MEVMEGGMTSELWGQEEGEAEGERERGTSTGSEVVA